MKYVYLFVEGNTDKALIEALLIKHYKLQNYQNRNVTYAKIQLVSS